MNSTRVFYWHPSIFCMESYSLINQFTGTLLCPYLLIYIHLLLGYISYFRFSLDNKLEAFFINYRVQIIGKTEFDCILGFVCIKSCWLYWQLWMKCICKCYVWEINTSGIKCIKVGWLLTYHKYMLYIYIYILQRLNLDAFTIKR